MITQSQQLKAAMISVATDFVGLVETAQNKAWDDPLTLAKEKAKSDLIRGQMQRYGWDEGEPYCAAFLGAVVALAAQGGGLRDNAFRRIWTPHCMTNVRKLQKLGLLETEPSNGALMLMQKKGGDQGHAALVCSVEGTYPNRLLITVEGNTMSGKAGNQRDGDGIFQRVRNVRVNGNLQTQGFLPAQNILDLLLGTL